MSAVVLDSSSPTPTTEPASLAVGCEVVVVTSAGSRSGLFLGSAPGDGVVVFDPTVGVVTLESVAPVEVVCPPSADSTVGLLLRGLAAEASAHARTRDTHRAWTERLTEEAHQEADDRGWCEEFDEICDRLGLERRSRDYEVRVEFSGRVYVTVTASTEEAAEESITASDVRDALAAQGWEAFDPEVDDASVC